MIEAKLDAAAARSRPCWCRRARFERRRHLRRRRQWGRVRALIDDKGERSSEAGPSVPVEVLGLNGTPLAGDVFDVVDDEAAPARSPSTASAGGATSGAAGGARHARADVLARSQAGDAKELPVVVKSDVQGSAEAIVGALEKIATDEVAVRVLHSGVGGITESDVTLAKASNALIIGFNVRANPQARELAQREGVEIRYYSIIYNLVDDVKAALSGMLAPSLRERFLGNAQIREVFKITASARSPAASSPRASPTAAPACACCATTW